MNFDKKLSIGLVVGVGLVAIIAANFIFFARQMQMHNERTSIGAQEPVACTMEAKMCPDGVTYVGRQGPKCEFAACPPLKGKSTLVYPDTTFQFHTTPLFPENPDSKGYLGVLAVKGYVELVERKCSPYPESEGWDEWKYIPGCENSYDTYQYAFFKVNDSSTALIYDLFDYIQKGQSNSSRPKRSIGLGCYDSRTNSFGLYHQIKISPQDSLKLMTSNVDKEVTIAVNLLPSVAKDAGSCHSSFQVIKLVN